MGFAKKKKKNKPGREQFGPTESRKWKGNGRGPAAMVAHPNYIRGGGAAWEVATVVAMENEVNDYFTVV